MEERTISSLQHPLIKHLVKLRQNRNYREEEQLVLVYGNKIIQELSTVCDFKTLIIKKGYDGPTLHAKTTYIVNEEILKKIAGTPSVEDLAAEVVLPQPTAIHNSKKILALDAISDPGNMGTLVRTAVGFGFDGIFLLPHCVDLFNEKTIRASKGASFKVQFQLGEHLELKELINNHQFTGYIADIEGQDFKNIPKSEKIILILGNESQGLSKEVSTLGKKINIPLSSHIESLNVAVAGGILMCYLSSNYEQ